jgi:hypothetical protein
MKRKLRALLLALPVLTGCIHHSPPSPINRPQRFEPNPMQQFPKNTACPLRDPPPCDFAMLDHHPKASGASQGKW